MTTVRQLLGDKGHDIAAIDGTASVYDAIRKMADENIGSLVVMQEGKLAGIITERHYARNVILEGKSSASTPVQEIMSTRVVCAWPDQTVEECMAVMTDKGVRHLPVLDHKQLVGMISIGDLVKSIIVDQKFIIEQLEHYIQG
jgi:CBS domain-containing protein